MIVLSEEGFVKVSDTKDIQPSYIKEVQVDGESICIVNVEGKYYAIGNICTHPGAELHEGELNDKELKCPWHGAKWDITTSNLIWFPQNLKSTGSYPVIIENEMIYVEVH